jgi:uncharacterized protein (UPF0276 family)
VKSPLLLTGIGLRTQHYTEFLEKRPRVAWLEVHSEDYFGEGGKPLSVLDQLKDQYPISLHGVGLSIGSADELNWQHLKKWRDLIGRIHPCLISDHLAWSSINGHYLHDLLPLPYTEEALSHIVERVKQVQDYLQRQILIENIASYVSYPHSTIPEWEFLTALAQQSGCGILLDVSNVYISGTNLNFDPYAYLAALSTEHIQEVHLAGFTSTILSEKEVLIDSHNRAIVPAVWDLYRQAIKQLGTKPTIIEWDTDLPSLETVCLEAYRAEQIMRETYVTTKRTG